MSRTPRMVAGVVALLWAFVFVPELHQRGARVVLGQEIPDGGMSQGEAVLDLLVRHPSTARFITTKLARRFVSDDPPEGLVRWIIMTSGQSSTMPRQP